MPWRQLFPIYELLKVLKNVKSNIFAASLLKKICPLINYTLLKRIDRSMDRYFGLFITRFCVQLGDRISRLSRPYKLAHPLVACQFRVTGTSSAAAVIRTAELTLHLTPFGK